MVSFPKPFLLREKEENETKKENEILPVSRLLFVPIHPQAKEALFLFPWEILVWEKAKKIPETDKDLFLRRRKNTLGMAMADL